MWRYGRHHSISGLWESPLNQAVILTDSDPLQLIDYPIVLIFIALGIALVIGSQMGQRQPGK
jgi:hypothetical protein